jgi:triosephosphate isomerase (TIM)
MRRYFVAANWKMNGKQASNAVFLQALNAALTAPLTYELVLAVPFVYLAPIQAHIQTLTQASEVKLAAQNVSEFEEGAYTGEVSAAMLADMHCAYALVGHSERRLLFCESNESVSAKFAILQKYNIKPILCVGETLEERAAGKTEQVIAEQLNAVINILGVNALEKSVLAYEPVWAIGTGKTASPEQAQVVHQFLREKIAKADSVNAKKVAEDLRIIYGGSVNAENAQALFEQKDIDGGLIGGASLQAESFLNICKVVNRG